MNRTPLYIPQQNAGATFTQLDDWEIASNFGDVATEYKAAKEGAALLDRSYFGRFRLAGKDSLDLINRLSSNKVDVLLPGAGAGTVLTTNKGRVIDVLYLFALENHWVMLTSPQTRERIAEWIDLYTFMEEATLEDITQTTAMITLLGPQATALLEGVTGTALAQLEPYSSIAITIDGVTLPLLRTDPVDVRGYDLVVPMEQAQHVWSALADPSRNITLVGEETYNILRVEAGLPRYGWEMSEQVNPWEVDLRRFINFEKGCYIGQEVILRLDTYNKVQKLLMALTFSSAGVTKWDTLRQEGKNAGTITSVVEHPISGQHIGLGLVRSAFALPGTQLEVMNSQGSPVAQASVRDLPATPTVPS